MSTLDIDVGVDVDKLASSSFGMDSLLTATSTATFSSCFSAPIPTSPVLSIPTV
eukprot:CAMPEP_0194146766 /NCGR_PEP_ID=MMETSP0152-20130528/21609_1 /TAXON_ID=1049557 /ORGANISM="Thalassiothrix antarctica, Strain L6-D1" /LENGTH=53 /DNA_ID=CAMNT_0038847357 /DNA_START=138 /DNA_END=299 /DNA_ORIENTATION=-